MKRLYLILFLLILAHTGYSQNEAGPDKVICKGSSVKIGSTDKGYCYFWDAAPGLSSRNVSEPTVNPTVTTTYRVTVIGQDFSFRRTDDVVITVVENTVFIAGSVTVADGAAPSLPLNGAWGLTYPENVMVDITACSDGSAWHAVVTSIRGNYSLQAILLPGISNVTGPGGNTTQANFCLQARELYAESRIHNVATTWFMLQAVVAHERVHATRFKPALETVARLIESSFEALSVPDNGQSQQAAINQIKALGAYNIALSQAQQTWLADILLKVANDHNVGGPTDVAEWGVVDPMIATICNHAKAQSWGPCASCPP